MLRMIFEVLRLEAINHAGNCLAGVSSGNTSYERRSRAARGGVMIAVVLGLLHVNRRYVHIIVDLQAITRKHQNVVAANHK
jgi:hypothetical protein